MLKFNWTDAIQNNWFKLDLTYSNDLTKHYLIFSKLQLFKVNNFQCWQLFALFNTSRSTSSRGSSNKKSGEIDYNITTLINPKSTYRIDSRKKKNEIHPNVCKCLQVLWPKGKLHHILSIQGFIGSSWLRLSGSSGAPFSKSDLESRAVGGCLDVWKPQKMLGNMLVCVGMIWKNIILGIPYIYYINVGNCWYSITNCWSKHPYCWSYNGGCFLSQTWYRKAANQISISLMKIG